MLSRILVVAAAIAGAAAGSAAAAQSNDEVVLYSQGHFKGFRMPVSGPTRSIGELLVKSVQIAPGSAWDLCSGSTFTGCKRFTQSNPAMVMTVRSARPVAAPIPATATVSGGPLRGSGGSLRGLASEYFVMPDAAGNRIEVDDKVAGALLQRATEFCRTRGWRTSAYQRVQALAGRTYLADVLCTNE
ncbi:MAG: hypothetical protein ACJ8FS_09240 [Sphingomicrobium sp.]